MSSRITSVEEIATIENTNMQRIIKEAIEDPRCIVNDRDGDGNHFDIYVNISSLAKHTRYGQEIYGLYIPIYSCSDIHVWVALRYGDEFDDGYACGSYSWNTSLDEIISVATNKANTCDFCKKNVGIENLIKIAFANKACENCAADARRALERPGWSD